MSSRWLPSLGRAATTSSALERKDAATQRASGGRGFVYASQPYTPPGADLDRLVRDGYEKVIWVFKAIDANADKLSSWPIRCLEGDPEDPVDDWKATKDPILPVLNQYSNQIERSAKYFRYRLASQLIMSKRGVFVEVIPTRAGSVGALNLLPPAYTRAIPDPDTFLKGFEVALPGTDSFELPVYDPETKRGVLWIRKPHPTDPYSSVTPLEAAGISIDLDFYARLYNRNFLLNDGRAGQLVAVKGGLSPEDAQELKARFAPGVNGAGRTTIIEAEAINVQDTAVTPRDAQYAELRNITKDDLLIALGTPESVIGNASGRTFDNADAEKENWLDVTVLPLAQVIESGFDGLTEGGWDDQRRLVHDTSREPVLQRAFNKRVADARTDVAAGLITVDEFREIAKLDPIGRPASRVLWVTSGRVPVGAEEDEKAAMELRPVYARPPSGTALGPMEGDPGAAPVDGSGGGPGDGSDLTGFDQSLNDLLANATGTPQGEPQALTAASAELDLETKAFNPRQPRYPAGHPQAGQWMDSGDVALWLAGKPLKGGFPSSTVVDPNTGSTAAAATTPAGVGGTSRFLSHPDPKVAAAAALITFPPKYAYARALGAPPARPVKPGSQAKLVSLRRGDVIEFGGGLPGHPGAGVTPDAYTVTGAKRTKGGNVELELVNNAGDVHTVTAGQQQTVRTIARTPHPTDVAAAKREVAAAAQAMARGAAPAAPAPAQVAPAAPAAAPAPAVTPGLYSQPGSQNILTVHPNGTGTLTAPGGRTKPISAASIQAAFGRAGSGWAPHTPAPAAAPTPAPAAPTPGANVVGQHGPFQVSTPGTYIGAGGQRLDVFPDGSGNMILPNGIGTKWTSSQVDGALKSWSGSSWQMTSAAVPPPLLQQTPAAPASAVPGPPAVGAVGPFSPGQVSVGQRYESTAMPGLTLDVTSSGGVLTNSAGGSSPVSSADVARHLTSSSGALWAHRGPTPAPAAAPTPTPPVPAAPSPASGAGGLNPNLPPVPAGAQVFVHPQGKTAYVLPNGTVVAYGPSGKKASTSATAAKLQAGYGSWKQVTPGGAGTGAPTPPPAPAGPPPINAGQLGSSLSHSVPATTMQLQGVSGVALVRAAPAPLLPQTAQAVFGQSIQNAPLGRGVWVNAQGERLVVAADGSSIYYPLLDRGAMQSDPTLTVGLFNAGQYRLVPSSQIVQPGVPSPAAPTPTPTPAVPAAPNVPTPQAPAAPAVTTGSPAAAAIIARGAPTVTVSGWTSTGGSKGSNPAAMMTDPAGTRFYVKSNGAAQGDNEVAASMFYAATGANAPEVSRARIAAGSFPGQRGTEGIASRVVDGKSDMSSRMRSDPAYRDKVLEDFATHAWLANWDAVENNNTITLPNGEPLTVDVGGSLLYRAQGGKRNLGDKVDELTSMRTGTQAGSSARATFSQLTPDHTDARFVAGVERIAAISPAQIQAIVDAGYPSMSAKDRSDLAATLVKRRAFLAAKARVTLPENRKQAGPPATIVAPAGPPPTPTPTPTPVQATPFAAALAAAPPVNAPTPAVPTPVALGAGGMSLARAQAIMTPPANYPYPRVPGAPVAKALPSAKQIKVASLRKGDVLSVQSSTGARSQVTVVSVDRATGDIVGMNNAGQRVTLTGTSHPTGSVTALARTPHPSDVAQARRVMAAGGPVAPATPAAPASPSPHAANVALTTPAFNHPTSAAQAARSYGAAQQGGYAPIPGQTYADQSGNTVVVHSDGSGTAWQYTAGQFAAGVNGRNVPPSTVSAMLANGTQLVPVGPVPRTAQFSIPVGRRMNGAGDIVDVHPDGTGTLTLGVNGSTVPLTETAVDSLINPSTPPNPQQVFVPAGATPHLSSHQAATQAAQAPTGGAAQSLVGATAPTGGWGPAGQIVPGAVFVLPSTGATLTIGPRGGGKMTIGGQTRNMSAASAQSALNKRGGQWRLQTPGPSATLTAAPAAPTGPATGANQHLGQTVGQTGPFAALVPGGTYKASYKHKLVTLNSGRTVTIEASSNVEVNPDGSATLSNATLPTLTAAETAWLLRDPTVGQGFRVAKLPPIVGTPTTPQPAPVVQPGAPAFVPQVGAPATDFTSFLQTGQTFVHPRTGNRMVINAQGTGDLTLGPKARGGQPGTKTYAMTVRTLKANGWIAETGPDITAPGPRYKAQIRKAQRMAALPGVDVPYVAPAPAGAYPPAATGPVTSRPASSLSRGETIRVNGEDWVVTETGAKGVWGYRPGVDNPNTITRQPDGSWLQGVQIPSASSHNAAVDVVGAAPVKAANVPTQARARAYDAALPGAATTTGVGTTHGAGFPVTTQNVSADTLQPGDSILLNGREAEGLFVVTSLGTDSKGRQAVYGYAGTTADLAGGSRTPEKLFLTSPSGNMRTTRVQVDGAVPSPPSVPRPTPPKPPAQVERTDISDATSQAKLLQILNAPPPSLSLPASSTRVPGQDELMAHLQALRGYNAHPDVISEAEMDDYVDAGEIEIWRGMQQKPGVDVAEAYRSGRHYPGGTNGSQYGVGTYAAYGYHKGGQRDALKFVVSSGAYGGGHDGVVVRMTIKPEARIIEYDALMREFRADNSPVAQALRSQRYGHYALTHYAVIKGYDIVRKSHGYQSSHPRAQSNNWDDGFIVILNRSAMRISEKNYIPDRNPNAPAGNSPPPKKISQAKHRMKSTNAKHENDVDYKVVPEP